MNLILSQIILQAKQPQGGGMSQMLLLVLLMGVMFVFMILPQMRKQKKAKAYQQSLAKGSFIVTNGGIHGKISTVNETNFIIEVEDGSKIKIEKAAVNMELTQAHYKTEASESK